MKRKRKKGKAPSIVLRATRTVAINRPIPGRVPNGHATGASTKYSPELAAIICERIAGGECLNQLSRDPEMPSRSTIRLWLLDPAKSEFSIAYARAKKAQIEHWADEIVEISDDSTNDYMNREIGRGRVIRTPDPEVTNRARLRIDARKWLMSKLDPKKYGDKIDVSLGGRDTNAIPIVAMTADEAAREYLRLMEKPPDDA